MKQIKNSIPSASQITIYETEDGKARISVRFEKENVWLTQNLMADLFECSVDNVSLHLKNIFAERELDSNSVVEDYSITAADGKSYKTKHYSLEAIIAVGYRVNSARGAAGTRRDIIDIAPEEIGNAAMSILKQHISIDADELARETSKLFGYGRLASKSKTHVDYSLSYMVSKGLARKDEDMLVLSVGGAPSATCEG